jgi:hypothetical protein
MRLGKKLAEGFAVDPEAERPQPAPEAPAAVEVTAAEIPRAEAPVERPVTV